MLDNILRSLSEAPDSQIATTITDRIIPLIGQPNDIVAKQLIILLDECVYTSLASDFAVVMMDAAIDVAQAQQ